MTTNKIEGKTVVITAGNRGGGSSIALRYAAAGASVAIISDKLGTTEISDRIVSDGGKSITLPVDFTNSEEIQTAITKIVDCYNSIDILINNFSTLHWKNIEETTSQEFHVTITNIFATFFFSQYCIPYLKNSDNPHVINISPPFDWSVAKEACQNHLLFSISKYGMSFCTMGMAEEFKKFGIAFNSLWQERPIMTPTLKANFNEKVIRGSNKPEVYAEAAYLISLKSAKEFTGNYCIDEAILKEAGININQYAIDPEAEPVKDIFLSGVNYELFK